MKTAIIITYHTLVFIPAFILANDRILSLLGNSPKKPLTKI
jgi:hypothetical protein